MFENMVKSAALPMILEMLHAAHDGIAKTAERLGDSTNNTGFDGAIRHAKFETYQEIAEMVANIIDDLDTTHQQVHGTPAPHPAGAKTNFNHG